MKLQTVAASVLFFLTALVWRTLLLIKHFLRLFPTSTTASQVGRHHTVLVTTGRQVKTLHIVRALKQVGATVIVSDYAPVSASAVSLACDKFIVLDPLDTYKIEQWIDKLRSVILDHDVDLVLPVSSINEVLFVGLAKQRLQNTLPHVKWFCPDLETALLLDNRTRFSTFCGKQDVPVPEHGIVISADQLPKLASQYPSGVILKRVESSLNRSEEIVRLRKGEPIPRHVRPSPTDSWQWQSFIEGDEYSVWYICDEGNVRFSACYRSQPDLFAFDAADMCEELDVALRCLVRKLNLTGQYSFDFFIDNKGFPYVIECNPRASSVLETVSKTPCWGEAFFGVDVFDRTVRDSIGFIFHKNCWPWAGRSDGYFQINDPLPFFAGEIIWPLRAVAKNILSGKHCQHVDVNICKLVEEGPSIGRHFSLFLNELTVQKDMFNNKEHELGEAKVDRK